MAQNNKSNPYKSGTLAWDIGNYIYNSKQDVNVGKERAEHPLNPTNEANVATWEQAWKEWNDMVGNVKDTASYIFGSPEKNVSTGKTMQTSTANRVGASQWLNTTSWQPTTNDRMEWTAWGYNYNLNNEVTQPDNQQWHYNALVGSWAVAGMPPQYRFVPTTWTWKTMPTSWTRDPFQEQRKWKAWQWIPWLEDDTPTSTTPTTQTVTKQPTASNQNPAQPTVNPDEFWWLPEVNPNEFWWLQWGESIEQTEQKIQANEQAIANMESDLNQSTTGRLYWKVTADQSTTIRTLQDDNSVYRSMAESRISTFKDLQTMDNWAIAAAIIANAMPSDSQAMRDLMQYDPAKYQEVQNQIKQLKWQMTINSITNGDTYPTFNNGNAIANDISDFAATYGNWTTSTADILKNVNSSLNSNDAASTASETMASIESDMAVLQNRLKNLKKEASTVFKWDVPQYIVNAYISNRTAEIQDQMSILENRYNSAQSRYQQEWERTKRAAEFDLKKQELAMKRESMALDDWSTRQWIALKRAELNGTTNWTTPLSTLTLQESMNVLSNFSSSYANNSYGWQCGTFVKRYLSQIGVNLPNVSSINSKMSLIDPNITEPNQWDIIIMSSTKYPENWHMAIVESIDDDWTIHLLESNHDWDQLVHRRPISPKDSKILGYYRPTGWWSNVWANTSWSFTRKDWTAISTAWTRYENLSLDEQKTVEWLVNRQVNPASLNTRFWVEKWNMLKTIAAEVDPNYTDWAFATANKTRDAWSTSTSKGSNSRNGTAVATAKELYEMADEIWNTRFKDWNSLVNSFKNKMSDEQYIKFVAWLNTLAFEYAWALKWWASPTEQDVRDAKQYITADLWGGATKATAMTLTQMLYNKNVNEAQNYYSYTYEKAPSIWDRDVEEWMMDVVGLDLPADYALKTNKAKWWTVVANANGSRVGTRNISNQEMVNNIFS